MEHIHTKWHHIRPLIDADEVYLTAPRGGKAHHWGRHKPSPDKLKSWLEDMDQLPRFCIDSDLMDLVQKEEFTLSLLDMKKADVLRLPFPAMIIEFEHGENHHCHEMTLLRDLRYEQFLPWEVSQKHEGKHQPLFELGDVEGGADYYGVRTSIERDKDGHYFVLSPSVVVAGVHEREGKPWIAFGGEAHQLLPASPVINDLVKQTYMKDAGNVFYAAAAAYLLMATGGVEKQVITCEKVNRKRRTDGKPLIPRHTYVHIKKVYRAANGDAADDYIPRKSPRPHWRRAHLRNVRFGAGRLLSKPTLIPGRLVAYHGGQVPKAPVRVVTE